MNRRKNQAERQKAIADFIGHNYSPIGATSQKCYKTTVELVYELSNIVDVAPMELAKQLTDARYHVEYLAGQPYWVLYDEAINTLTGQFFLFLKSLLVRVGAFLKYTIVILYQAIRFLNIVRCIYVRHEDAAMSCLITYAQYVIMPEHVGYSGILHE